MGEPRSLLKLSLDTIGKYFCELCSTLVPYPGAKPLGRKSKRRRRANISTLQKVCRHLHSLLAENIPATLANDVTNTLLSCLDTWESERQDNSRMSIPEEVYDELVRSVIHPAVTRIEAGQDLLDCSDIFPYNRYKNFVLVRLIMKAVNSFPKLRALNLFHTYEKFEIIEEEFPPGLEEFSGLCNDKSVEKLANSCKRLKCLNLCGLRDITNASISVLLKMENLEKLNIAHTGMTSKGILNLLLGIVQKGENSKLKYLVLSKYTPQHLAILEDLPNLRISLHHDYCTFFLTLDVFRISDLYSLKNLHGLEITTSLRDLNDLLRHIGEQLVYLEVTIEIVDIDDRNNDVDATEMLLIGQYCKNLRCLHIAGTVYGFPSMREASRKPLPGFQTITCLKLEIESGEKSIESNSPHKDLLYFLISQCVNVKKVVIPVDTCFFSKYDLINNMIETNCMKNLEEVYFKLCCCECTIEELDDVGLNDQSKDSEVVQILVDHCPNLRIVGGVPGLENGHNHNTQRLKVIAEAL